MKWKSKLLGVFGFVLFNYLLFTYILSENLESPGLENIVLNVTEEDLIYIVIAAYKEPGISSEFFPELKCTRT